MGASPMYVEVLRLSIWRRVDSPTSTLAAAVLSRQTKGDVTGVVWEQDSLPKKTVRTGLLRHV